MNKKKILLIGPMPPPSGGVSVHLQRLLRRSNENPDLSLSVFDLRKLKLYRCDGTNGNIFSALLFFLTARIVHIHLSNPKKILIARCSRFFGKKVFYTQHNPRELNLPSTKLIIKIASKTIFVFNPGNIPSNGLVIPAFIHSDDSRSLPNFLVEKLKQYKHVIVSVSSYSGKSGVTEDIYGFDIILDAVKNLPSSNDTTLILVDSNEILKDHYSKLIHDIEQLTGIKIIYIGYDINFPKLLSLSDVFIRATRSDGDSISVREALDASVPVLASDCVARPEGCITFHSGDAKELSILIEESLKNKNKRKFPQEDFARKIFDLYEKRDI